VEGIFTLPYSEYDSINTVSKLLKKSDGYGFYIPVSRQQKGTDFIIMNHKNGKSLRVQVKSSRSYIAHKSKRKTIEKCRNHLWFNNFLDRYDEGNADLYLLYGLYPQFKDGNRVTSKDKSWKSIILCFSEPEMFNFLKEVKTKKEKKSDKFFGLEFDNPDKITTERGFVEKREMTDHLVERYINKITEMLK